MREKESLGLSGGDLKWRQVVRNVGKSAPIARCYRRETKIAILHLVGRIVSNMVSGNNS